jgi:hypothetical protein
MSVMFIMLLNCVLECTGPAKVTYARVSFDHSNIDSRVSIILIHAERYRMTRDKGSPRLPHLNNHIPTTLTTLTDKFQKKL